MISSWPVACGGPPSTDELPSFVTAALPGATWTLSSNSTRTDWGDRARTAPFAGTVRINVA
jgi:hypothetical protein